MIHISGICSLNVYTQLAIALFRSCTTFNKDLQGLLHEIYDQGAYDLRLDYSRAIVPALSEADAVWVDEVLREQGLR
ncbi:MAG: DUF4058 family protein [Coleofasciculus sp. Co-bin14]|nr:DUF4058 family protein [Coleofasciculus sp. Co-bin14]